MGKPLTIYPHPYRSLEIFIQSKRLHSSLRLATIESRRLDVDVGLDVVRHTLLEEVRLALERDHLHEVEGVRGVVVLLATEGDKKAVSDELDVLAHEFGVHADEGDRESIYRI